MQAARRRGLRLPQPEGAAETPHSSRHESPDILLGSDINGHSSQIDDEERVGHFPHRSRKVSNGGQGIGCVAKSKSAGAFKDAILSPLTLYL